MENKLTWVELKKVVARQTGLSEKEVNQILNIWLDEMVNALKRGEELHINGLGTFRMKKMKERKSVNVTTGEAILLPETNRLTYMMAAGLEEQLRDNVPARLEVGIDPIKKLSEQADEIVGLLGELGQSPNAIQPQPEPEPEPQPQPQPQPQPEPEPQPQPQPQPQPEPEPEPEPKKKKQRLWLTALITILIFFAFLVGAFFFFQTKMESWIQNLRERAAMTEVVGESESESESESVSDTIAVDTIAVDTIVAQPLEVVEEVPAPAINLDKYRTYDRFITVERMHKNSRLSWMAYRYYGKKELWVFIYDANRDHLKDPENIRVDTPIRIPKLSQEVIDLATPELQALVQQMTKEFLGR